MSYVAHIEPLVAILRVFREGDTPGIDEYEWSATVSYSSDGKIAEIKGVTSRGGAGFSQTRKLLCKILKEQGVDILRWERRGEGRRYVDIDTNTGRRHKLP